MTTSQGPAAVCPCTGLAIPECSCQRCLEEQMRNFSPLVRRGSLRALPSRPFRDEPREDGRAAA